MIRITDMLAIDESELEETFVRASGPGGQNVNKVATAVRLRFDLLRCSSIDDGTRERAVRLAGKRMTKDGVLVIEAGRFRTQERNRMDARERLATLLRKALSPPVPRKKTKATRASKERRLEGKKKRSDVKSARKPVQVQ